MLRRVKPQKVANEELGYIVQSKDRFHVEYVEACRRAIIEVEHGVPTLYLYTATLKEWVYNNDTTEEMTPGEIDLVLSRINEGMQFMACKTEIC